MYILPTPSQLILIILDFMNSPSVGPQAACIHHVRKLVSQKLPCHVLNLQVVGDELLALEGLKHGLLKASARGSGVGRGASVGRRTTAERPPIHLSRALAPLVC